MKYKKLTVFVLALLVAFSSSLIAGRGAGSKQRGGASDLSASEIEDLVYIRQEEKLARDVYLTLFDEWGLQVFSNIAESEQTHTDKIENLLEIYNIEDPIKKEWELGGFVDSDLNDLYGDLIDEGKTEEINALKVGVVIEETDIMDLLEAIKNTDQVDILTVYENLLCGSRNHLRAFVRQLELGGVPVELDEYFEDIAFSSTERCGGR